jgi:predicted transposase YdaD
MKRLLQIKPEDWVNYIYPGLQEIKLTDMPADFVPAIKTESRMDCVKWLNGQHIVHFEPMGYRDMDLPPKMLRYRSDIWEWTSRNKLGFPQIIQVVIFFKKQHDNKVHTLRDAFNGQQTLTYSYTVIKAWELDGRDILDRKLAGLYPLLPFVKWPQGTAKDTILASSVQAIEAVRDPSLSAELLTALSILAEDKLPRSLIRMYIRKEKLMKSGFFSDLLNEAAEEKAKEIAEVRAKEIAEVRAKEMAEVRAKEMAEVKTQELLKVKTQEMAAEMAAKIAAEISAKMAANMLLDGVAPNLAAKYTGLPFEKISELQLKLAI